MNQTSRRLKILNVDPTYAELSGALDQALRQKLSARLRVEDAAGLDTLPPSALAISGCFTRIEPGDPAERMIGMNLGASRLAAHVRILVRTETGFAPVTEFDVEAKGGNLLPPLGPVGLVVHGVKEFRQTLSADAGKLAGEIAQHVSQVR